MTQMQTSTSDALHSSGSPDGSGNPHSPANNSERSCPPSPENTQPSPYNSCPKITALAKSPSTHPLKNCTYNTLQSSQPSYIFQLLTIQPPGSTRSSLYLSLSWPAVSSSLKFCNCSTAYAAPALWNGLQKDLHQFADPPNPPSNLTDPPLALASATFHSRLKTELF